MVGHRLGAEVLGLDRGRLQASHSGQRIPGRRERPLRPEPGRGVGGDVPAHGRAQERHPHRELGHRLPELLPERGGVRRRFTRRSAAVDGRAGEHIPEAVHEEREEGVADPRADAARRQPRGLRSTRRGSTR